MGSHDKKNVIGPGPDKFDIAPWMKTAYDLRSLDWKEIAGSRDNPNIVMVHQSVDLHAQDDETAWCSAMANYIMKKSGFPGTNSAMALSWRDYGKPVAPNQIRFGDILVADYHNGHGHVTFFDHWVDQVYMACLGGNQSNNFQISNYPKSLAAYIRRPA